MGLKTLNLLFLFYLLSSSFNFDKTKPNNNNNIVAADQNLIQKTCRNTLYYKLCISSLKSDPTSLDSDTKGLAEIVVKTGIANATATSSYISSQFRSADKTNDTNNSKKQVLKECAEKYAYAAEALRDSIKDLAKEAYDYAYIHISAAADYPNSCHNAFNRFPDLSYPPKLARREEALKHICRVVLGIIDLIGW